MNKQKIIKYVRMKERLFLFLILFNFSILIIIAGAMMNFTAVNGNGGKMPVYADYISSSADHLSFTDKSLMKFFYLSDIFKKKIGNVAEMYYSIGDVLIFLGFPLMVINAVIIMVYGIKLRKTEKEVKKWMKNLKN